MSRCEMARLWRIAPLGHPYFSDPELYDAYVRRFFGELGGFNPEVMALLHQGRAISVGECPIHGPNTEACNESIAAA